LFVIWQTLINEHDDDELDLIYELDVDILKTYLHTKMKFLNHEFRTKTKETDRQRQLNATPYWRVATCRNWRLLFTGKTADEDDVYRSRWHHCDFHLTIGVSAATRRTVNLVNWQQQSMCSIAKAPRKRTQLATHKRPTESCRRL